MLVCADRTQRTDAAVCPRRARNTRAVGEQRASGRAGPAELWTHVASRTAFLVREKTGITIRAAHRGRGSGERPRRAQRAARGPARLRICSGCAVVTDSGAVVGLKLPDHALVTPRGAGAVGVSSCGTWHACRGRHHRCECCSRAMRADCGTRGRESARLTGFTVSAPYAASGIQGTARCAKRTVSAARGVAEASRRARRAARGARKRERARAALRALAGTDVSRGTTGRAQLT